MINPLNLQADIFNGIMQNINGAFPQNFAVNRTASESDVNAVSFSEALAQRLTESEYPGKYEFRRIINEEIASAVDRHSSDLVALLSGLGRTNFDSFALMQGRMPTSTTGMNAVLGIADPFDTLRFYGSLLRTYGQQRSMPF
jgi:hypothetical protein